jgi:hypothetical protein
MRPPDPRQHHTFGSVEETASDLTVKCSPNNNGPAIIAALVWNGLAALATLRLATAPLPVRGQTAKPRPSATDPG